MYTSVIPWFSDTLDFQLTLSTFPDDCSVLLRILIKLVCHIEKENEKALDSNFKDTSKLRQVLVAQELNSSMENATTDSVSFFLEILSFAKHISLLPLFYLDWLKPIPFIIKQTIKV